MDELSTAYRALKEYKDLTDKVPEIRNFLAEMHGNSNITEHLESLTTLCKIDSDWVDAIQRAIPFISDAVMENRQFVRSDGEVLPIEKIRSVGKDTIYDLSKHSNYITRGPDENGKLVPDKLMMPQKDNDYAVYENRFLYSLLIYLSQFIEIRLNEITAITGKYQGKTKIVKNENTTTRHLTFELTFDDTRFNDPFVSQNNGSSDAIDIIKSCLNDTKSLLMTPLMKEVSKAPMVHPPIVKTNVFKFDHNFKESLALYEFLQSYTKKGFTIEDVAVKMDPFQVKMAEYFSELVYLTSYLTYIYGNNLNSRLKKIYDQEERQKKIDEENKVLAEIKRIDRNIKDSGMTPEEYALLLQKGEKVLEKRLLAKDQEIIDVRNSIAEKMRDVNIEYNKRFDAEKLKFNEALLNEKKQMDSKIAEVIQKSNEEIEAKATKLANENQLKAQQYEAQITFLKKRIEDLESSRKSFEDECIAEKNRSEAECNQRIMKVEEEASKVHAEAEEKSAAADALSKKLTDENTLLRGQMNALRYMNKLPAEKDMTEKENFKELEKERDAFEKFFGETWQQTKKRIRKENLTVNKQIIQEELNAKKAIKDKEKAKKLQEKAEKQKAAEELKAAKQQAKEKKQEPKAPLPEEKKDETTENK